MIGIIYVSILLIERRNPSKFLLSFLSVNQSMWRSFLSSLSFLKKRVRRRRRRRRRRRGVKGEEMVSFPKHVAPIIDYDDSELDDVLIPKPMLVIMIGKSTLLLILKIFLVPILKIMRLIIVALLVLYMFLPVTSQDFIKFWGNFFAFVLSALIEISQGFETFEFI
jgi:hypothetical protein